MQTELMYRKSTMMTRQESSSLNHENYSSFNNKINTSTKDSRETIHSGHFMVSDFEAEAQDDEDELAVPVPEEEAARLAIIAPVGFSLDKFVSSSNEKSAQQLSIETSLNKLFQCMSLAYRQKLTSPKWNRFKGIRLRWKDKIRLNNVIWRCWHMQFILKQNTLVCQFASPLDVDTHNKPEAVVLEGKYWKRKLAAVTAEYKKWRMFYRNRILGWTNKDGTDMLESMDMLDWDNGMMGSGMNFGSGLMNVNGNSSGLPGSDSVHNMMVDEDYMELMTDTLFSTISSNQPLYFPDPREIARGASLADFIQPSLGPLQPNLDDFMDTLEPLQEFLNSKLPPVPEEDDIFRSGSLNTNYSDLDLIGTMNNQVNNMLSSTNQQQQQQQQRQENSPDVQSIQYNSSPGNIYRNNDNYPDNRDNKMTRIGRSLTRGSRVIQHSQQNFPPNLQHQVVAYQPQQQLGQIQRLQSNSYTSLDLQQVQLPSPQNHLVISSLSDPTTSQNQRQIDSQVHNLISPSQTFSSPSTTQQQINPQNQQRQIHGLTSSSPTTNHQQITQQLSDPFKLISPQQSPYKLPQNSTTNYPSSPQFKYRGKNSQNQLTNQSSSAPQASSQMLLQNNNKSIVDLTAPALHPTKLQPRTSTILNQDKEEVFAVPKYQMKARNRSRSSSALGQTRNHPPPLVSAISDPSLNINNNVLLAHLLTNNTSGLYTVSTGPDKIMLTQQSNSTSGSGTATPSVKKILPLLPSINSGIQLTNSIVLQQQGSGSGSGDNPAATTGESNSSSNNNNSSNSSSSSAGTNSCTENNNASQGKNSPNDTTIINVQSPNGLNSSPLNSPMNISSPLSPNASSSSKLLYLKNDNNERGQYKEQRRVGHIHAEQKRRYNIKNGFDMLHNLIPQLSQNPNTKLSKAAMLQKGADYIRQLRNERNQIKEEMFNLKQQIDNLNLSITNCQSLLPATGAPISRQRTNKMKEMYDDYVKKRTRENWKFWIFSILLEPLMISFNTSVSTASIEDLCRSTILWVEQHCSLVDLRPAVLNSLRYLCTATEILSDPGRLPEEALAAIDQPEKR